MKSISFSLQAIVLAVLALLSGMVHGKLTNRWGAPPSLQGAGERLEHPPQSAGEWRLKNSEKIDAKALRQLECPEDGYINSIYERQRPGQKTEIVRVAVLVGPPGPISVHTPEVCYANADYKTPSEREPVVVAPEGSKSVGDPDELWRVTLTSRGVDAHLLRVYYGWGTPDGWQAAKHPRIRFAGQSHLYKIQVAGVLPPGKEGEQEDPCREFLTEFLPVLQPYLAN